MTSLDPKVCATEDMFEENTVADGIPRGLSININGCLNEWDIKYKTHE